VTHSAFRRRVAVLLAACAAVATPLAAQQQPTGFPATCAPGEVQVMLLGTFHFEGSTGDAVQSPLADVLSPPRQAELDELVTRLAAWSPDLVAIEWPAASADSTAAQYGRYAVSGSSRSANEGVQVGFRLARRMGHATVHPIDHQMPLGNDSLEALMQRRPEIQQRVDSLVAVLQARTDSVIANEDRTSIIQRLRDANTEQALHGGNSMGMFGSFLAAGEGSNHGGPRLLARWYERNFIMAHNLTRVVRPGTRRVLMVVGSGHVPPLRNILAESPDYCPVSPLPYLN
jgi:hypothetical protein